MPNKDISTTGPTFGPTSAPTQDTRERSTPVANGLQPDCNTIDTTQYNVSLDLQVSQDDRLHRVLRFGIVAAGIAIIDSLCAHRTRDSASRRFSEGNNTPSPDLRTIPSVVAKKTMPFSWKWWLFCAILGTAFFLPSHAFSTNQGYGHSCRTFRLSSHEETSAPIATAQQDTRGEATRRETLLYLQDYFALSEAQMKKLESKVSMILGMQKETLEPKILYLKERLSLDDKQLSKLIQRLPAVLGLNIEENLEPKLLYMQERLSLDDQQLSKLVQRFPQLLCLSVKENLERKLLYMQERLSLDDKQLSKLIQRLPSALGYRIEENLEPKIDFLESLLEKEDARDCILTHPSLLGSSLEKRLKPRLVDVQEAGIPIDPGTIQRMGLYTEEQWSTSLAYQKKKKLRLESEELG